MFAAMVIDCDSAPYTINMKMERLVREEDIQNLKLSSSFNQALAQDVLSISGRFGHDFVS